MIKCTKKIWSRMKIFSKYEGFCVLSKVAKRCVKTQTEVKQPRTRRTSSHQVIGIMSTTKRHTVL